jgi:hypothetical protein
MNLSKSGPSVSFGVRGAHVTVGKSGVRQTIGIPGTGVFYTRRTGTRGIDLLPSVHDSEEREIGHVVLAVLVFLILALLVWGFVTH